MINKKMSKRINKTDQGATTFSQATLTKTVEKYDILNNNGTRFHIFIDYREHHRKGAAI
jgi:hypothetical protein